MYPFCVCVNQFDQLGLKEFCFLKNRVGSAGKLKQAVKSTLTGLETHPAGGKRKLRNVSWFALNSTRFCNQQLLISCCKNEN